MNQDFTVQKETIFVWGVHLKKKNSCTSSERKKNSCNLKIPHLPHHFSNGPSLTKTGIEGVQNQRNLVTVHSLMPTLNYKKANGNSKGTTRNAQHWADLRKNASPWELSTLQKWPANAPGSGIGTVTTADISMLSLERNSVLSELTFQHFK